MGPSRAMVSGNISAGVIRSFLLLSGDKEKLATSFFIPALLHSLAPHPRVHSFSRAYPLLWRYLYGVCSYSGYAQAAVCLVSSGSSFCRLLFSATKRRHADRRALSVFSPGQAEPHAGDRGICPG